MGLFFKPHIATLPAYKPPVVPPGVGPVVDLSSNENPLGPSPKAVAALHGAADGVNRYPDACGTALKLALANKWDLRPSNVALANGADEWVLLLCISLLDPGDQVIVARGSFISYGLRAIEVGAKMIRVPLQDHVHDLDAMAEAITDRTRLVFVCNPNNPTGTMVSPAAMKAFLEAVPEHVAIVVDQAYYEYVDEPNQMCSLEQVRAGRQNLIVLRSFSKVYGLAGLRVGYMLAARSIIDYMERARPPFNVNRLAQEAARAALDDREHVLRSVEANRAAKRFFYRELTAMGLLYIPTHTNFIAVDVDRPGAEISGPLLDLGFVTAALDGWGVPNHVRFSFGTADENRAFVAALNQVMHDSR